MTKKTKKFGHFWQIPHFLPKIFENHNKHFSCQFDKGYRMVYELSCLDETKNFVNFDHKGGPLPKKTQNFCLIQT